MADYSIEEEATLVVRYKKNEDLKVALVSQPILNAAYKAQATLPSPTTHYTSSLMKLELDGRLTFAPVRMRTAVVPVGEEELIRDAVINVCLRRARENTLKTADALGFVSRNSVCLENIYTVIRPIRPEGKIKAASWFVDGVTVAEFKASPTASLSQRDFWNVAHQLLCTLQFVHQEGFAHRAISENTVYLENREGTIWPVLRDFGLAGGPLRESPEATGYLEKAGARLTFKAAWPPLPASELEDKERDYAHALLVLGHLSMKVGDVGDEQVATIAGHTLQVASFFARAWQESAKVLEPVGLKIWARTERDLATKRSDANHVQWPAKSWESAHLVACHHPEATCGWICNSPCCQPAYAHHPPPSMEECCFPCTKTIIPIGESTAELAPCGKCLGCMGNSGAVIRIVKGGSGAHGWSDATPFVLRGRSSASAEERMKKGKFVAGGGQGLVEMRSTYPGDTCFYLDESPLPWCLSHIQDIASRYAAKGVKVIRGRMSSLYASGDSLLKIPMNDRAAQVKAVQEALIHTLLSSTGSNISHMAPMLEVLIPNREDYDASVTARVVKNSRGLPPIMNVFVFFHQAVTVKQFVRNSNGRKLVPDQFERLVSQMFMSILDLHHSGVSHGAIDPEHFLISNDNGTSYVMATLIDLGWAFPISKESSNDLDRIQERAHALLGSLPWVDFDRYTSITVEEAKTTDFIGLLKIIALLATVAPQTSESSNPPKVYAYPPDFKVLEHITTVSPVIEGFWSYLFDAETGVASMEIVHDAIRDTFVKRKPVERLTITADIEKKLVGAGPISELTRTRMREASQEISARMTAASAAILEEDQRTGTIEPIVISPEAIERVLAETYESGDTKFINKFASRDFVDDFLQLMVSLYRYQYERISAEQLLRRTMGQFSDARNLKLQDENKVDLKFFEEPSKTPRYKYTEDNIAALDPEGLAKVITYYRDQSWVINLRTFDLIMDKKPGSLIDRADHVASDLAEVARDPRDPNLGQSAMALSNAVGLIRDAMYGWNEWAAERRTKQESLVIPKDPAERRAMALAALADTRTSEANYARASNALLVISAGRTLVSMADHYEQVAAIADRVLDLGEEAVALGGSLATEERAKFAEQEKVFVKKAGEYSKELEQSKRITPRPSRSLGQISESGELIDRTFEALDNAQSGLVMTVMNLAADVDASTEKLGKRGQELALEKFEGLNERNAVAQELNRERALRALETSEEVSSAPRRRRTAAASSIEQQRQGSGAYGRRSTEAAFLERASKWDDEPASYDTKYSAADEGGDSDLAHFFGCFDRVIDDVAERVAILVADRANVTDYLIKKRDMVEAAQYLDVTVYGQEAGFGIASYLEGAIKGDVQEMETRKLVGNHNHLHRGTEEDEAEPSPRRLRLMKKLAAEEETRKLVGAPPSPSSPDDEDDPFRISKRARFEGGYDTFELQNMFPSVYADYASSGGSAALSDLAGRLDTTTTDEYSGIRPDTEDPVADLFPELTEAVYASAQPKYDPIAPFDEFLQNAPPPAIPDLETLLPLPAETDVYDFIGAGESGDALISLQRSLLTMTTAEYEASYNTVQPRPYAETTEGMDIVLALDNKHGTPVVVMRPRTLQAATRLVRSWAVAHCLTAASLTHERKLPQLLSPEHIIVLTDKSPKTPESIVAVWHNITGVRFGRKAERVFFTRRVNTTDKGLLMRPIIKLTKHEFAALYDQGARTLMLALRHGVHIDPEPHRWVLEGSIVSGDRSPKVELTVLMDLSTARVRSTHYAKFERVYDYVGENVLSIDRRSFESSLVIPNQLLTFATSFAWLSLCIKSLEKDNAFYQYIRGRVEAEASYMTTVIQPIAAGKWTEQNFADLEQELPKVIIPRSSILELKLSANDFPKSYMAEVGPIPQALHDWVHVFDA